jgi:hypothetical protein
MSCCRCGRCCFFYDELGAHKCKHLVILKNKKTLCRIFKKRLGQFIGYKNVVCGLRSNDKRIFEGCPLNSKNP